MVSTDKKPIRSKQLTVGCDPEFFLKYNNQFIPAYITEIAGTKDKPLLLKTGGAVQIDGMALEFNIPPQTNAKEFTEVIYDTLSEIRGMVDPRLKFHFFPDAQFNQKMFDETPSKFKELGCDPDYDAYNLQAKTPPNNAAGKSFRTAGGHWHFGYLEGLEDAHDPRHIFDTAYFVRCLEAVNVIALMERNYSRTKLYGSKGSFRPKSYGFEWRSPSNVWLNLPVQQLQLLFTTLVDQLRFCIDRGLSGNNVIESSTNLTINQFYIVNSALPSYHTLHNWIYNHVYYNGVISEQGIARKITELSNTLKRPSPEFNYSKAVEKNFFILNENKVEQTLEKMYQRAA